MLDKRMNEAERQRTRTYRWRSILNDTEVQWD